MYTIVFLIEIIILFFKKIFYDCKSKLTKKYQNSMLIFYVIES